MSQFGDGLFQGGLVGGLIFSPERAATPWAIAGQFAVLFLPYSLLGPFAGALLDRWDRRTVLIGANVARLTLMLCVGTLLAVGASDRKILLGALIVNGFTRFVASGLSAALPHVVPKDRVVTMNSLATAFGSAAYFFGANFMLLPRWVFGAGDTGSSAAIFIAVVPVVLALWLSKRFKRHVLGPDDSARAVHGSIAYAVATGWVYGVRTVVAVRTVGATLAGMGAHRIVFAFNTMLVLVIVRHTGVDNGAGLGTAVAFGAATGGAAFLANFATPSAVRRWGRYKTANGALLFAALVQLGGIGLRLSGDDGVRLPAGLQRSGREVVCGLRDAARRRRRAARPRVHGSGLAVLGVVHRRAHGVRGRHPRRRALHGSRDRGFSGVPGRPCRARRHRQKHPAPAGRRRLTSSPWLERNRSSTTFARRATPSTLSSPI